MGPIATENEVPRRTLVACLVSNGPRAVGPQTSHTLAPKTQKTTHTTAAEARRSRSLSSAGRPPDATGACLQRAGGVRRRTAPALICAVPSASTSPALSDPPHARGRPARPHTPPCPQGHPSSDPWAEAPPKTTPPRRPPSRSAAPHSRPPSRPPTGATATGTPHSPTS